MLPSLDSTADWRGTARSLIHIYVHGYYSFKSLVFCLYILNRIPLDQSQWIIYKVVWLIKNVDFLHLKYFRLLFSETQYARQGLYKRKCSHLCKKSHSRSNFKSKVYQPKTRFANKYKLSSCEWHYGLLISHERVEYLQRVWSVLNNVHHSVTPANNRSLNVL